MPDDTELSEVLSVRIAAAREELCDLLYFKAIDAAVDAQASAPLNAREREEAKEQLQRAQTKLEEEIEHQENLQAIEEKRVRVFGSMQAAAGVSTAPEIVIEIEALTDGMERRAEDIARIRRQRQLYQEKLASLP